MTGDQHGTDVIDCLVLGAGVAGLAAAVRLTDGGRTVAIAEARPHAGGRVWSFPDADSGVTLDNGQHLLMGCYTSTLDFLRTIGSIDRLTVHGRLSLQYQHTDGRRHTLDDHRLPWPLGPAAAVATWGMLSMQDRWQALRLLLRMRCGVDAAAVGCRSVLEYLEDHRQGREAMELLWEPIVIATMNARMRDASAAMFLRVMSEVFFQDARGSQFILPRGSLDSVFVRPARDHLHRKGCNILLHHRAMRVITAGDHFTVEFQNGAHLRALHIICTLPPWSLRSLAAASDLDVLKRLPFERFRPSAILAIHMVTTHPLTTQQMLGCLGSDIQWVFPKGRVPSGGAMSTCILSAPGRLADMPRSELTEHLQRELCRLFALHPTDIRAMSTVLERRATFIPEPGLETVRASLGSGHPRFHLAGDWTDTGLPATIEGAVRSAEAAVGHMVHGG